MISGTDTYFAVRKKVPVPHLAMVVASPAVSSTLHVVALGGGSGTRFWPVSRRAHPKQLLALGGESTLLLATFARVRPLAPPERWWMVVGRGHAEACRAAVPEVPDTHVLVEPASRNTAPAIGLAAIHLARRDPGAVMVVLPADHAVADPEALNRALGTAAEAATGGGIVTLGVEPSHPETAYGYIEGGDRHAVAGVYRVRQFLEKPDRARAERLLDSGGFYWNAGIFVMRASTYLGELAQHLPRTHAALAEVGAAIGTGRYDDVLERAYVELEGISVDYGIMEHAADVAVVPVRCGWSDVGSWNALGALVPADASGNRVRGRAVVQDSRDCVLFASDGAVIGVVGLDGLVVVHTPDATLVVPASRAQEVRGVTAELAERDWSEFL